MIFVNELAGIRDIPSWMKHMPKNADAMSFVDVVFPAFLFIAGMSIPFALNNRFLKGDSTRDVYRHILWRTVGLLTLGLFMVNAEGRSNPGAMPFSIHIWALLFFVCAILVWNVYTFKNKKWVYFLRGIGIAGLIILALIYRGGEDGTEYLRPRWWGILGLIGWAYLFSCIFYLVFRGKITGMVLVIIFCTGLFAVTRYFDWNDYPAKNATHIAIMTCGIIATLILFDEEKSETLKQRFTKMFLFAALLFVAGYFLRPYYQISKILATPTWGFYCSAICCILFCIFYWIVDIRGWKQWTSFFRPAASNPLLTYIIPDIVYNLTAYFHFSFIPFRWRYGMPGIIWCICYAIVIMWIAAGLNKMKIRLQL
jgi:predicted acyltransferase